MILPIATYNNSLDNFCIVGVNYRKSDMNIRGKFSLSQDQSLDLLKQAVSKKIPGCLVLSTCNRTEVYGICNDPHQLIDLLCNRTNGLKEEFLDHGYIHQGLSAIDHLFKVASGLDSQIIGDYEILAQIKQSAKIAKENGCINSFMERAINYALQVSKEIKTKTKISTGTISVSYAAIEIIKEKIKNRKNKKVLLVGTGKFGNHIAKNLRDYLPESTISFTNRTDEKAFELAEQYGAEFISYKNLPAAANDADIIIVSSAAGSYTVHPSFFITDKSRLILDLSVPQNVDPAVKNIAGVTLLNVDEVSVILDETISARQAEIPKALQIIDDTLNSLEDWHRQQFNNPLLRIVKSQLHQLSEIYFEDNNHQEIIHKTVSSLAIQLKHKNDKGCQCINALNSYLHLDYETTS
ncbi:MAG: glutamyl-tRNA reductase [Bacteroidota bacterium]|nr:glutamyl-tRNA reductase [Bacteroidota bacterium]